MLSGDPDRNTRVRPPSWLVELSTAHIHTRVAIGRMMQTCKSPHLTWVSHMMNT
jgi:hypothetical protein